MKDLQAFLDNIIDIFTTKKSLPKDVITKDKLIAIIEEKIDYINSDEESEDDLEKLKVILNKIKAY